MSTTPELPHAPLSSVSVMGSEIHAVSPEGKAASIELACFTDFVAGGPAIANQLLLPTGVKSVRERGSLLTWTYEADPLPRMLKWIAHDSPASVGPEAVYRRVTIALPYVVVIGVFVSRSRRGGSPRLPMRSLACVFFRNKPLESLDDELCYPALLNCLPGRCRDHPPLSCICTQYLDESFHRERNEARRFRRTVQGMVSCLFDTGFNHHAEEGGTDSWFTASRTIDPRIASIEAWEQATAEDPAFACTVPWIKSDWTVRSLTDHFLDRYGVVQPVPRNAPSLARFVMKHAPKSANSKHSAPS